MIGGNLSDPTCEWKQASCCVLRVSTQLKRLQRIIAYRCNGIEACAW